MTFPHLPQAVPFQAGDQVVLAMGNYHYTRGTFVRLKEDVNWAEIKEQNGKFSSHPVSWLQHLAEAKVISRPPSTR